MVKIQYESCCGGVSNPKPPASPPPAPQPKPTGFPPSGNVQKPVKIYR